MTIFVWWVMILAIVTAATCALPGIWLVLRKQSMLTDAISHAVLPGIVIAAVATGTIQSPWSIVGAAVMGTVVVLGAELLESTGLVSGDGPQGLVFPALFSIGVLLLSTRFNGIQISESAVLVGDLNLAAFLPLKAGNLLLGPQYLWVMTGVLLLNVAYLTLLHTRLKLIAFDPELAQTMGIPVKHLGHLTMLLVSVTITAAFNAAGAVLVMALMIVPAAIAQLLAHSIRGMYVITIGITFVCSVVGFWSAYILDASTSSGLALFYGIVYFAVVGGVLLQRRLHQARS